MVGKLLTINYFEDLGSLYFYVTFLNLWLYNTQMCIQAQTHTFICCASKKKLICSTKTFIFLFFHCCCCCCCFSLRLSGDGVGLRLCKRPLHNHQWIFKKRNFQTNFLSCRNQIFAVALLSVTDHWYWEFTYHNKQTSIRS